MLRLLFVTVTMTLFGLGSGYFLWGSRVARLTESLSGLTLELDTMRERLAHAQPAQAEQGSVRAVDELRVINESVAAMRQELAQQKDVLERTAAAAVPADSAAISVELRSVRNELAICIADKQDLALRNKGGAAAPAPDATPPPYIPQAPSSRPTPGPAAPSPPAPPPTPPVGSDLSDPRF